MSRRSEPVSAEECVALGAPHAQLESYPNRQLNLGALAVTRALPIRERRLVGPWCFMDRFGPLSFDTGTPMDVAPHPHIGLQTVTWLLDGEVMHADHLGSESLLQVADVPVIESPGTRISVFAGTIAGATSPAPHHSEFLASISHSARGISASFRSTHGSNTRFSSSVAIARSTVTRSSSGFSITWEPPARSWGLRAAAADESFSLVVHPSPKES
jgi:redox-sensitive bicupin YhaK (pirin superfamily)